MAFQGAGAVFARPSGRIWPGYILARTTQNDEKPTAVRLQRPAAAVVRLSHELPLDQFQESALALVKQVLPFDSSMWGTATDTDAGIDIHTIHLHNQPQGMLAAYEEVKHLDTAADPVQKLPGGTLASNTELWFSGRSRRRSGTTAIASGRKTSSSAPTWMRRPGSWTGSASTAPTPVSMHG